MTNGSCFWSGSVFVAAFGRSTLTPCVSSGAVTMNMMSRTSMTSMYGTTLISPISFRRRTPVATSARSRRGRVPLQNRREFLGEGIEAQLEAIYLVRVAVVGNDGGNRRKESHRGRDERLGDARRDHLQRRLLHVGEPVERIHDAPHGAEQPNVGTCRAHRGERREIGLKTIHLTQLRDLHGAARAFHQLRRVDGALRPEARKLAKAELEDAFHFGRL